MTTSLSRERPPAGARIPHRYARQIMPTLARRRHGERRLVVSASFAWAMRGRRVVEAFPLPPEDLAGVLVGLLLGVWLLGESA